MFQIDSDSLNIKVFDTFEMNQAIEHSMNGGMSVHLHFIVFSKSPKCFRRDVENGIPIAHLFCQNKTQLGRFVRQLGVNVVVFDREGEEGQHVDLCGGPLRKCLKMAGKSIEDYKRT